MYEIVKQGIDGWEPGETGFDTVESARVILDAVVVADEDDHAIYGIRRAGELNPIRETVCLVGAVKQDPGDPDGSRNRFGR